MCAGCITTVDSYVYAAVGAAAAVEAGVSRVRALFDAEFASERHVLAWRRNADFCEYMGLDPVSVLGPVPLPQPIRMPALAPALALPHPAWA